MTRERSERGTDRFGLLSLLGSLAVALFVGTAFTPLPNLLSRSMGTPVRLERADAIVVLGGGGVRGDGTLSNTSLQRAVHGILLYREGLAPLIVFSGSVNALGISEAQARARLAGRLGVPQGVILTEGTARTTREEAERIGALLRGRGLRRVLLIADWEGMGRAKRAFEHSGVVVLPAPTDDVPGLSDTPEGRLGLARRVAQETLAALYYRAAGFL